MFREYSRALFKRVDKRQLMQFKPPVLPARIYSETLHLSQTHYQKFCELVGWQTSMYVHPLYLQMMSLELQMQCLLDKKSPFPLLGLVHVENQVNVCGTLSMSAPFECRVKYTKVSPHSKGWVVDISLDALQNGMMVYNAVSSYLVKVKAVHVSPKPKTANNEPTLATAPTSVLTALSVPGDIGRSYAKISGDYNPIHLFGATAKLFGFKQPIAHGMWTLAQSISSAATAVTGEITEIQCSFKRPIPLPSSIEVLQHSKTDHIIDISVADSSHTETHLSAKLCLK
ncbi:hypothetical protein KUL49_22480 [Alteromonas sp. KUL49]|nr:hypothetical protein EYS00_11195 [Alteromonas sp. KUL49]GEA11873.1 hypothetical protein KUL49_22480 [Alteromonas sp. KUL49]